MIPAIDDKIKQQKGGSGSENSPSFSDISDDAAPTLEKEEVSIFVSKNWGYLGGQKKIKKKNIYIYEITI